ncbi:MAG TPA: hypothetical protein VFO39_03000 [Candidatus Sulfotelmatobacter sp.]|nr:hypothetical protein [Candidatus Sulfotelmatobacter sp.]
MNRCVVYRLANTMAIFLVFAYAPPPLLRSQDGRGLSTEQWRNDLRYLAEQMPLKHKSLFHTMHEAEFHEAVAKLDSDIPSLNEDQILVRLLQIMAMVQDGHTGLGLRPIPPPDRKDHIPIRFERYPDGIYVRAAAPEYAAAVGGKVIQVGSVNWKDAIQRADSIEPHDPGNDGEQLAWSARTDLNYPRILHGLGLSNSSDSADFLIEKNGRRQVFAMKASVPLGQWYLNSVPTGWVDARPTSVPVPLSRQHEGEAFWFVVLPEQHLVYFQFNLVFDLGGETLRDFAKRLSTALERPDVHRLVIDVRNNTGGDNTLLHPLLVALIRSKVNHRGGIYVITGPVTFSACQNFVNRLENYADVIFVGSPTGENVNFYGDPAGINLPNSHLEAAVSRLWWQDEDPRDKRVATDPELALASTFGDYMAGKDPALEFAMTTSTPLTIEETIAEAPGGLDGALAAYGAYVRDPLHRYLPDPERRLNSAGYKLLAEKRVQDAIVIFEVNVRMHPNSWNAYDSLADGYAAANDRENALRAYKRSLDLNPENANAKRMIQQIEHGS